MVELHWCRWDDPFLAQGHSYYKFTTISAGVHCSSTDRACSGPERLNRASHSKDVPCCGAQARGLQALSGSRAPTAAASATDSRADASSAATGHLQQWLADDRR